jgi:hypothetical protein
VSALALVHQRFSTNTFPEWPLAHPYRMVAHNGEINTVKGNFNWMRAREGRDEVAVLGDDLKKLYPISFEGQSDTATFDNALELLDGGYPLAHAAMMMIPEAWEQHELMDERRRAFYEYHAAMLEPWDGPAAMVFTDGKQIGATLDRNGLRPARYIVTDDDLVVMASESGVLPIPENRIVKKWRLQPGKMFLIDLEQGRIIDDEELKNQFANAKPYRQWIENVRIKLDSIDVSRPPARRPSAEEPARPPAGLRLHAGGHQVPAGADGRQRRRGHRLDGQRQPAGRAVGQEQAAVQLLQAAVRPGDQPADRPDPRGHRDVAEQLHRPQAQPAGHQRGQPADAAGGDAAGARLRRHGAPARDRAHTGGKFKSYELDITYPLAWGREGVEAKLAAVRRGRGRHPSRPQHPHHHRPRMDRASSRHPGAAGAVGHPPPPGARRACAPPPAWWWKPAARARCTTSRAGRLRRRGRAPLPGAGDAGRSAQGAAGRPVGREGDLQLRQGDRQGPVEDHVQDGHQHLHVVLRRPDLRGHRPAEGLRREVLPRHRQPGRRHRRVRGRRGGAAHAPAAFGNDPVLADMLDAGGEYAWRTRGEEHMWTPDAIAKLQHSVRANKFDTYKEYAQIINDQSRAT